jgi:hypothetical protein
MNRFRISTFAWALMLAGGYIFSSCNKHEHDPEPTTGSLMFHIHTMVDTNEVEDYGTVYTFTGGRKIIVDLAQLYMSEIELIKLDGSSYPVSGKIILKKQESEEYEIGDVPIGNYKTIRFKVGLNSTVNASTPLASDTVLNQPSMWFSTSSQPEGYAFLHFKGSIDTSATANGTTLSSFDFKIGTSAHFHSVTLPEKQFSVSKSGGLVHFVADYSRLFKNVDLKGSLFVSDKADNTSSLAATIGDNIMDLFDYED